MTETIAIPIAYSSRPRVKATPPYLLVSALEQSIAYYEKLGFEERLVWGEPPCFAMLHRDGFDLMLRLADSPEQIRPNGDFGVWDVCILVEDARAEAAALGSVGIDLTRELTVTAYEMVELDVVDPDGYRICFGSDCD